MFPVFTIINAIKELSNYVTPLKTTINNKWLSPKYKGVLNRMDSEYKYMRKVLLKVRMQIYVYISQYFKLLSF